MRRRNVGCRLAGDLMHDKLKLSRKARRLIRRLADACEALSWISRLHPDAYEIVRKEHREARRALSKYLETLEFIAEISKARNNP